MNQRQVWHPVRFITGESNQVEISPGGGDECFGLSLNGRERLIHENKIVGLLWGTNLPGKGFSFLRKNTLSIGNVV
jgi:hypothetical protein